MAADDPMTSECPPQAVIATSRDIEAILHPLVILNLSDHWTRTKAQDPEKKGKNVYGALLGKHEGRHLELVNSFELRVYQSEGFTAINEEFLRQREAQYKEVFPEMELIGWYCSGDSSPTENDMIIQRKFTQFVESPILFKLDPAAAASAPKLPIGLWENGGTEACSTVGFRPLSWILVSEDSERIGVDHVTRFSCKQGNQLESEAAKHIRSSNAAISMLVTRVQMIRDYLVAVSEGRLPANDDIMREANKLCQRMPRLQPAMFGIAFETQEDDINAAVLLSKMSEMCGSLGQLVSKVNLLERTNNPSGLCSTPQKGKMESMSTKSRFLTRAGLTMMGSSNSPDLFNSFV